MLEEGAIVQQWNPRIRVWSRTWGYMGTMGHGRWTVAPQIDGAQWTR